VSPGQAVSVAVRPEKISLQRTGDALSLSKGGIRGRIEELIYIGTDTRYVVRLTDRARLTVRTQNVSARDVQQFHQGEEVGLSWDADGALVLVD
jgi:spermidine/putrescine transport system ATP-binding protein